MFSGLARLEMLKVGDVMSRQVIEVSANQGMSEVASEFAAKRVTSAPVVDEQGRCVGMISASDFVKRDSQLSDCGPDEPHQLTQADTEDSFHLERPSDKVRDYMTTAIQSADASQPLLQAARMMSLEHIHHLPVIENGRAIGVISAMDVVAALLTTIDELSLRAD